MKSKIFKTIIVLAIITTMVMADFVIVGQGLISYAADSISTNHQNVEFEAYFKDSEGNKNTTLKTQVNGEKIFMYLDINVKKEGYFEGEIHIDKSNFKLKKSDNEYVSKIEDNVIYLNQINVGTIKEIKIEIEPIQGENYEIGLLDMETQVNLKGIYRDSKQKDIEIKAQRQVALEIEQELTEQDLVNEIEVITNKVMKIGEEQKRVLQISYNIGLKENNYPMQKIEAKVQLPEGQEGTATATANLNNMTEFNYKSDEASMDLTLENKANEEGNVNWKKQGMENVIITCIYDANKTITEKDIIAQQKVVLYGKAEKEIAGEAQTTIKADEIENAIQITTQNLEESIYKGKIKSENKKQYESETKIKISSLPIVTNLELIEDESTYEVGEDTQIANVTYDSTTISVEELNKILGENGKVQLYDQNETLIATLKKDAQGNVVIANDEQKEKQENITVANNTQEDITVVNSEEQENMTVVNSQEQDEQGNMAVVDDIQQDEQGNITIVHDTPNVTKLIIKIENVEHEGNLKLKHTKTIHGDEQSIKDVKELKTKAQLIYNETGKQEAQSTLKLEDTITEAKIEMDKDTLSTVLPNDIEMRITLLTNSEKYDLYKNPKITIEMPEQVENISINNAGILYGNGLNEGSHSVDGRTITLQLIGEQTQYAENAVEGPVIILNMTVDVNKKSASQEAQINMTYQNEKEVTYASGETGVALGTIKIVAPKNITTIDNIQNLGIETVGQEEKVEKMLEKGQEEKEIEEQIEIINNNENAIENVKILGDFPTDNDVNNLNVQIKEPITIPEGENAKIYYSENQNATNDLSNAENQWSEQIQDNEKTKKYLIVVDKMESTDNLQASYKYVIPENLQYNQQATTGYTVTSTNSETKISEEIDSTKILTQTGIGPEANVELTSAIVGKGASVAVKNGEVIRYNIKVSNTGSEDMTNIKVTGQVPEGTVLVEPEENYEYIGAVYYKELEDKIFETNIENLKVGETANISYEVRVKNDTAEGTELKNIAQINYAEVKKKSEEIKNVTEKGTLRVTVKRITDRKVELYEHSVVRYFAIIENISDEKQDDVKVKTNFSDNFNVHNLELMTGLKAEEYKPVEAIEDGDTPVEVLDPADFQVETKTIEYSDEINLGSIESGKNKILVYEMKVGDINEDAKTQFSVNVVHKNENYSSNIWEENVKNVGLEVSMTATPESEYVQNGDTIEYEITVKNNADTNVDFLSLSDEIPEQLTVQKITKDGEELENNSSNNVDLSLALEKNATSVIKIGTIVDYSEQREQAESITNLAKVSTNGEVVGTTSSLTHIIKANEGGAPDEQEEGSSENTLPENQNGDDTQQVPSNGNTASGSTQQNGNEAQQNPNNQTSDGGNTSQSNNGSVANKTITGVAWFDENANGKKDQGEKLLSNIRVKVLNVATNEFVKDKDGKTLEVTTNENGIYILDKLPKGKYIVIFEYDKSQYGLTKYKAQGISEKENSNATTSELTISNQKQQVTSTDIIEITNSDISNINIGFVKLQTFDLTLNKYVNRILVQNAKGTTIKEYNNSNIAKLEIEGKYLNGSNIIIEYNIEVTNKGDVEGYARKIADYAPADLKFSSELNKNWYQVGNTIYTDSLANQKIKPGETKTISLTLTKAMTENNTGSIQNTAEIVEDYNESGVKDSNSTPGNRAKVENDYGMAETLISVKTGEVVYIGIVIVLVATLGTTAVVIISKKNNKYKSNVIKTLSSGKK